MNSSSIHLVIDLETFSVSTDAAIKSIGLVTNTGDALELFVGPHWTSGVISQETKEWWAHPDRYEAVRYHADKPYLTQVQMLSRVAAFFDSVKPDYVWGNGVAFDNVILASAYRRMGMPVPWDFRKDMCYRTLKNLFPAVPKPEVFVGIPHTPLADAEYELQHLMKLLECVK